ncbi:hypothetical protein ACFSRY_20545, partial [Pontibacter locisalis]
MEKGAEKKSKRSQRDYSLGFNLQVVTEVESGDLTYKQAQKKYGIQGRSTVLVWLRKHGRLTWDSNPPHLMSQTPNQRIKELEAQLAAAQQRADEAELKVGRDKFFSILREKGLLVQPKKSYHNTTNSKHWMKKHRNLV